MSPLDDKIEAALDGLGPGELDALSADQVARLEGVLNRHPKLAKRFTDVVPTPELRLSKAVAAWDEVARPSAETWDAMWGRIDAALQEQARPQPGWVTPRIIRFWRPLAAVAASLLLAGVWLWTSPRHVPAPPAAPWPIEIAESVDFDQIDVSPGQTPVLVSTDPDRGPDVIWVMEEES